MLKLLFIFLLLVFVEKDIYALLNLITRFEQFGN